MITNPSGDGSVLKPVNCTAEKLTARHSFMATNPLGKDSRGKLAAPTAIEGKSVHSTTVSNSLVKDILSKSTDFSNQLML